MADFFYNIVWTDHTPVSVTVFDPSTSATLVATAEHPEFNAILLAIRFGEPFAAVRELLDKGAAIGAKFEKLSERVSVRAGRIYFDGVQVNGVLVDTIVRYHSSGEQDFMPLVNFMEKIQTNPNPHSADHLYRWLRKFDFAICPDGDFIAYKGINAEDLSVSQGRAIVDGEVIEGFIPNKPGSIVEMPRNEVVFDPSVGCSTGLHAATFDFARGFGSKVVKLKINPRDVVSVPTDAEDQKMRVCRYLVIGEVSASEASMFHPWEDEEDEEDEWALSNEDGDTADELVDNEGQADTEEIMAETLPPDTDLMKQVASILATPTPSEQDEQPDDEPYDLDAVIARINSGETEDAPETQDFDQFHKADFEGLAIHELRKLAKEWGLKSSKNPKKTELTSLLAKETKRRRKNEARRKNRQA